MKHVPEILSTVFCLLFLSSNMDALDVLLLWVVGFAALVFLIVENLDSLEESRKNCREDQGSVSDDSERKTRTGPYFSDTVKASDDQEEEEIVGADGEAEKQLVSEKFRRAVCEEIIEEEEEEAAGNRANASSEKSGFCSGLFDISGKSRDIICRNMGISEYDGEREESFDDWEGIERTELEKIFGEAMVSMSNADQIDEDVKLQLYGLQKVALEGACRGSLPMAFKVSARAKWNAWQKLGSMSRETAMEKFVNVLVKAIPGWKDEGTEATKDSTSFED